MSDSTFKKDLLKFGGINAATGNQLLKGNIRAEGNGSAFTELTVGQLTVIGNAVIPGLSFDSLSVTGNITSGGYFIGNGYYMTLNGLTLIPQGNVANAEVRLALSVPAGTLVTQTDSNVQYLLTTLPANANSSWLEFTGANFPVVSVFGRTGAISAAPNDYLDSFIQLSANVGTATTADHVSDALAYLNTAKANIVNGNVNATLIGNVVGTFVNATTGNIGNTSFLGGNVAVSGQINALGNVVGQFFIGNGSQLTGIEVFTLPATANLDITGNVIGAYANVANIIASQGNVGNTRLVGGNVAVSGQINTLGNVVGQFFIGNGSQLTGIAAALPGVIAEDITGNVIGAYANVANIIAAQGNVGNVRFLGGNVAVSGQINVLGNVVGQFFIGNGSQLTGITAFTLPATANLDIAGNIIGAYANVANIIASQGNVGNTRFVGGNVAVSGQINALGNVVGQFFIGNGSQLTGITAFTLPTIANLDIVGNVIGNTIATGTITASANLTVSGSSVVSGNITSGGYFIGNGYYMTLSGLTLIPQGNVANTAARLALSVPAGSLVTQTDSNVQYLLTTLPASANSSWLEFTGANFPVVSVFGRTGAVSAAPNDYLDSFIQLSANVGTATTTDHVSDALAYLNTAKANIVNGNVNATLIGNVIGAFANVTTGNIGNTRFVGGNVAVSGQINALGNVVAPFFIGNGSQLTGITATLPTTANIDITGNVIGAYANVANIIAAQGNVGNTRFVGGNVAVSGQINALGNVVGQFFIGNGSQLTGITAFTLPATANIDITGNVIGAYANVANIIAAQGNVGNTRFLGGNVAVSGQINVLGNVVAPFFIGDTLGNVIGTFANVNTVISTLMVGSSLLVTNANVTTLIGTNLIGGTGNVLTLIATTGNVGNTRFVGGNVAASGQINALGNVVAPFFIGNGSQLTGITGFTLPATANIDIAGNVIGAYANVANIIAAQGNVGNTRFVGGNVAVSGQINVLGNVVAPFFVGNGSQLTGITSTATSIVNGNSNVIVVQNGNISMAVAGTANVLSLTNTGLTILGNITATGNVTANALFVTGNVIGNITVSPNVRIFGQQTPFMWDAYVFGSPIIAGNNIVTAVTAGSGGSYTGATTGYRLSSSGTANQTNSLNWNLANVFDFSKDFELTTDFWLSAGGGGSNGDGLIINVGGSTTAGTTVAGNLLNGSLQVWFNSFAGQLEMYSNATTLTSAIAFQASSSYYAVFMGEKLRVETIGGRRFMKFIHESGHVLNMADVTFWRPAGSWLSLTGKTSAATSTTLVTDVTLSYL
ncbi:Chlorovirus glycoprotein repeat domain-containing protein [Acanthocystis turfacea Chlorella virus Can0610SP]|nr:Chlorovirus glycoprotein repeat domain-containing protein [Acanthocystis turfacea Chlorella virus Can0610SP]